MSLALVDHDKDTRLIEYSPTIVVCEGILAWALLIRDSFVPFRLSRKAAALGARFGRNRRSIA